jgi:predicted dehydrogenase
VIRWGICGTGRIAAKFAADLRRVPGATLAAAGSRTTGAAEEFGRRFGVPRTHGSYAGLAADDSVDVVYVATPQSRHRDDTLLFLAEGKAVLCEKPFAMDAAQGAAMVAAARAAGLFLMEAMWMRFLPVHVELRRLLRAGVIGTPHVLAADFGYRVAPGTPHRLLDPALGGGSLLDLGVYPVALALSLLGPPDRVAALDDRGQDGVDGQTGVLLGHPGGALAVLYSSILGRTPSGASITGSAGRIDIDPPCHASTGLTVHTAAGTSRVDLPYEGAGLHFEAAEVVDCLRAGRPESPAMPLADTLAVLGTLDRIRSGAGNADRSEQEPVRSGTSR